MANPTATEKDRNFLEGNEEIPMTAVIGSSAREVAN